MFLNEVKFNLTFRNIVQLCIQAVECIHTRAAFSVCMLDHIVYFRSTFMDTACGGFILKWFNYRVLHIYYQRFPHCDFSTRIVLVQTVKNDFIIY